MPSDPNAVGKYAHWTTTGWFNTKVVGLRYYRDAIASIAKNPEGFHATAICLAYLVPDNHNPHDANAVKVFIDDKMVGFLAAEFAKTYRSYLEEIPSDITHLSIGAAITGGLTINGKSYDYQVELDFPENLSIVRSATPVVFESVLNYGYGPLIREDDKCYRATVWLPSADLHEFHRKLLVDEWTTDEWDTVNVYLANRQNVGTGFKIYAMNKQDYESTFRGRPVEYSLEIGDNRFANLKIRVL